MFNRAARLATAALVVFLAACHITTDSNSETETPEEVTQNIEIPNVFSASAPSGGFSSLVAAVEIRKIRLTVREIPGDNILFQKTYDVDPTLTKWTIPYTAPKGKTVRLIAELMSVAAGVEKVEYSGQAGPVVVGASSAPTPIQTYPGPVENLGATSVTLTPDTKSINVGETTALSLSVLPGGVTYSPTWRSTNTAVATVSPTGSVSGVAGGSAMIIASVGAKADTATVNVAPVPVSNTCVDNAYTIGSTANAGWTNTDCLAATSGRRFDMWAFTIGQQTSFRIAVTGPNGRRVNVRRAGTQDYVQVMASEAFMPSTSNPLQVRLVLPAGSYVIEIASPDASTLGNYTLATTVENTQDCSTVTYVTFGVTISEQVNSSDCTTPGLPGNEDRFILLPDAGIRLDLSLVSSAFAPVLVFRDDRLGPASPTLAYDIEPTAGSTARVGYTTTFAGFTEIVVAGGTGAYTLTVGTGSATNTCNNLPSAIGARRMAVWETTDCSGGGYLSDRYPFTVTGQTAVKGTLTSTVGNTTLGVFVNGAEVLDWLRTASGDLTATWFLGAGSYEWRAGVPTASAGTSYTLSTQTANNDIGCANNAASGDVSFTAQTLGGSDCTFNSRYEDRITMLVPAGKDISVTMNGTDFAPAAIVRDPASTPGTFLVRQSRTSAGSVTATYRTTTAGYYEIIFSSDLQNAAGSYSGSITIR